MFKSIFFIASFLCLAILFYNGQIFEYRTQTLDPVFSGINYNLNLEDQRPLGDVFDVKLDRSGRRVFYRRQVEGKAHLYFLEDGREFQINANEYGSVLAFAVSDNGQLLSYLTELNEQISLLIWEEGFYPQILLENSFRGAWGTSISGDGNRIVIFPLDVKADFIDLKTILKRKEFSGEALTKVSPISVFLHQLLPAAKLPNDSLRQNKRDFSITAISGELPVSWIKFDENNSLNSLSENTKLKYISGSQRKSISKYSDLDGDGSDDLILFQQQPGLPIWRGRTLSNIEGPTTSKTAKYEQFVSWRIGDGMGIPLTGDFNGDGALDFATYTPNHMTGEVRTQTNWQVFISKGPNAMWQGSLSKFEKTFSLSWGFGEQYPLVFDYDGDGASDIVVFNPTSGLWNILYSKGGFNVAKGIQNIPNYGSGIQWGLAKDFPMFGDLDGNGLTDLVVCSDPLKTGEVLNWRAKLKINQLKDGKRLEFQFGLGGDIPFIGDFNGDGRDDPAVYRPATNQWHIRYSNTNGKIEEEIVNWGKEGAHPVVGDFDGDNVSDFAFFSTVHHHRWYILSSRFKSNTPKLFPAGRTPVSAYVWGLDFNTALPPQVIWRKGLGLKW